MTDLYRAVPADWWTAPFDLLREGYRRQRARGRFNPWRWNDDTQWTLYTSRDVSAALSEANQGYTPDPFGAVSLGASDLLSTGSEPPEWAVICFEGPMVAAGQVYDGDSEGFISRSDVRLLLAPRPEYVASQRFAADLRTRRGIVEFIVPSAPAFNAVPQAILWNHVLFGGNAGQFDPEDLPHGATIELVGFA